MLSLPLVRYILTAALRDRLMITLVLMIVAATGVGVFLGTSAVTEQASFSVVFGAGGLRILGAVGLILFICFYMRRSFDSKEVEFMLSRPLSRMTFLRSHVLAFTMLAVVVGLAVTLALFAGGRPQMEGLVVWGFSVMTEYAIMAVAALFFSIFLSSAAGSALATMGFYVLARLIGILIGIARLPPDNLLFAYLNNAMKLISIIIPRFDLLGQTSWLLYGVEGAGGIVPRFNADPVGQWMLGVLGPVGFIAAQAMVFCGLLMSAAAFDFRRREF